MKTPASTGARKGSLNHPPLGSIEIHILQMRKQMSIWRTLLLRMRPRFRLQVVCCRTEEGDSVSMEILFSGRLAFISLTEYLPVYLGDSAILSFLQSIRRLVERKLGPSPFTLDSSRSRILEATISTSYSVQHNYALPNRESAQFMVDSFFANVRSVLYSLSTFY